MGFPEKILFILRCPYSFSHCTLIPLQPRLNSKKLNQVTQNHGITKNSFNPKNTRKSDQRTEIPGILYLNDKQEQLVGSKQKSRNYLKP